MDEYFKICATWSFFGGFLYRAQRSNSRADIISGQAQHRQWQTIKADFPRFDEIVKKCAARRPFSRDRTQNIHSAFASSRVCGGLANPPCNSSDPQLERLARLVELRRHARSHPSRALCGVSG